MIINFREETPQGDVDFSGTLNKDEVDFLLRYALLSLLAKGLMPQAIVIKAPTLENDASILDDGEPTPEKGKLN